MVFSSQAFIAPSITAKPKMKKTSMSSSMISGGNKPKLSKTTVSSSVFGKQSSSFTGAGTIKIARGSGYESILKGSYVDPKYLPQKPNGLEQTLVETNNILVQIQKQLEIDFANRISERESEIKAFKKQSEKKKRISKEASLEKLGAVGKKITSAVSSVAKPFKSVFDTILEFFSIIFTGVVVNNAFNWLSKKENREKIYKTLTFLADNWKIIAGIIVGGIALRALYKVIKLVGAVRGALRLLGVLPKKSGSVVGDTPGRGGLFRTATGQRRGITNFATTQSRVVPGKFNVAGGAVRETVDVIGRRKTILGKTLQTAQVLTKKAGVDVMKAIGLGPGAKGILGFLRPVFKRIPFFGALIDFAVSLALGEPIGRAAAKAVGAALGGALGTLIPIPGVGTVAGGLLGDFVGGALYDAIVGPKDDKDKPKKMSRGGKLKGPSHASGGIKLNSQGDEAEGGEFIVQKKEVPKFEPILTDINDNGGRLWQDFVAGVKLQKTINNDSMKTAKDFAEVLKDYKEIVEKQEEQLKMRSTGGGVSTRPQSMATDVIPPKAITSESATQTILQATNNINNNISSPSMVVPIMTPLPIPLKDLSKPKPSAQMIEMPPLYMNGGSNMPDIPSSGGEAQKIPPVNTYDPMNEYLDISIDAYDIIGLSFGGAM